MPGPFETAKATMFAGARAVPATYLTAAGGPLVEVTLIPFRRKDEDGDAAAVTTLAPARLFELRLSEAAEKLGTDPARGDLVTVEGTDYEVDSVIADPGALVWRIGLVEPY